MDKVKIYYSKDKDTIDIWFGNPDQEVISEEVGEGLILKKDMDGKVSVSKRSIQQKLSMQKNLFLLNS